MYSDGKRNYSKMKHHPPYRASSWSESDDLFCLSGDQLPRRNIIVCYFWPFLLFLGILMRAAAVAATTLPEDSRPRQLRQHRKNQEEFCEWASVPSSHNGTETLHLSDDTSGDAYFGGSSDLSSSSQQNTEGSTILTAVVGGSRYNDQRGIAKVYLLDSNSSDVEGWRTEVASVEGEDAGDRLGADVAVSADGSTVALGVPGARQVKVFPVDNAAGMTTLDGNEDDFGFTVSLSTDGRSLAVGSALHSFLYRRDGSDWIFVETFADEQERSYGTKTVSLSGDAKSMALGGGFFGDGGRVRVVHGLDSADPTSWWWSEPTDDLNNLARIDNFDLSADGKHLVVMANANEDEVVRVYKFNETANVWVQQGQDPSGFSAGDGFGNWNALSLSADGGVLAVGAYAHNERTGYARVYKFFEQGWQQVGSDLVGDEIGDDFGTSVALDSFGGQLIVGALRGGPTNDGSVQHFVIQADCLESSEVESEDTESGDSGPSIGAIAGSAVGAVLVIGALGFVVTRRQQKKREPSTTAPISVSADALGGPDDPGEEPSIPMAEAFVLSQESPMAEAFVVESQTETSTGAMSDPCGRQAKPGLPAYKDQAREVGLSQRQPPQGRGVETGDVPGFKDQVRSAEPQKRVIEARRVG